MLLPALTFWMMLALPITTLLTLHIQALTCMCNHLWEEHQKGHYQEAMYPANIQDVMIQTVLMKVYVEIFVTILHSGKTLKDIEILAFELKFEWLKNSQL